MKRFFSIILLGLFAMTFTACEKCVTCDTDINGTVTSSEFCSKDSDERDAFQVAQELAGSLAGGTVTCTED